MKAKFIDGANNNNNNQQFLSVRTQDALRNIVIKYLDYFYPKWVFCSVFLERFHFTDWRLFLFFSASGASTAAIDSKIEKAMVSKKKKLWLFLYCYWTDTARSWWLPNLKCVLLRKLTTGPRANLVLVQFFDTPLRSVINICWPLR